MIESKNTQDLLSWTYAVVMAGGKGKRFWPESRPECPKPLLKILGEESMLQLTVRRISQIVPKKNILVVTNQTYSSRIREHLPEIPAENIISEPEGRDTAACIGLAALYVRRIDPEGVMLVTPADHFIRNQGRFAHVVRAAAEIARLQDRLVTIGIPPTRPETGYGYIHRGEQTEQRRGQKVHFVKKFVEKPNGPLRKEICGKTQSTTGPTISCPGGLSVEQRHIPLEGLHYLKDDQKPYAQAGSGPGPDRKGIGH